MVLTSRRLATALVIGAGLAWILFAAVVITMSLTDDLPKQIHPLYNLALAGLVALFLGAVVLSLGLHVLTAVRSLPAELGVDSLLAGQAQIIAGQLALAAASRSRVAGVRVVQEATVQLPAVHPLSPCVVELPSTETIQAMRRLARKVIDT